VVNPVIASLGPPAGATGGTVVINGSGFGTSHGDSQVKFNGVVATVKSWSETRISAVVPSDAASGPVTVTALGLTSNGVQFTVETAPAISSLSPSVGVIGSVVTISGSGFGPSQSNSTVQFNGVTATSSTWSDTQITAAVPPTASTGPVSVTVAALSAQSSNYEIDSVVQVTDSLAHISSYTSTAKGGGWQNTSSTGSGCSSCTVRGVITNAYDGSGNLTAMTDELGHATSYTYDANQNVASESAQLNPSTPVTASYAYNSFGEVLTMTDPLGT